VRHDFEATAEDIDVLNSAASEGLHVFILCPHASEFACTTWEHVDPDSFEYSEGKGNLICYSTYTPLCNYFHDWSCLSDYIPKTAQDVDCSFLEGAERRLQNAIDIQRAFLAFPAEAQEALSEEHPPMDAGDDDDAENSAGDTEVAEILDRERDLLDAIPLPGSRKMKRNVARDGLNYRRA
jgi:hypothetical protein